MITTNITLMQTARASLQGKWGLFIGANLVLSLVSVVIAIIPIIGSIASFLCLGAFNLGIAIFTLAVSRDENPKLDQMFSGFQHFGRALAAYFLMFIFTFLWSLLLIIPGIIAAISYSMTYFILADNEHMDAYEAIEKSKEMMDGHKWQYFRLQLRFWGLAFLCTLTLGIGFLWFFPYVAVTHAKFYEALKGSDNSGNTFNKDANLLDTGF